MPYMIPGPENRHETETKTYRGVLNLLILDRFIKIVIKNFKAELFLL